MRRGGDGGHVLDLEAGRAGRLHKDGPGVGSDQPGDAGADQGVVVSDLDGELGQNLVAHPAGRPVNRIGHQQVIARRGKRHQRRSDGAQARADGDGVGAAFGRGDGVLQGEGGGRSGAAIARRLVIERP